MNAAIIAEDKEEITQLCQQWVVHTVAHFNKENTLMVKYSFPTFHCHQGEHNQALNQLEMTITAWENDQDLAALSSYVRKTWPQWYVNHISTMDIVTSAFIKQSIANEG